jgi:hypothetical protein
MRFFRAHIFQRFVSCLLIVGFGLAVLSSQARADQETSSYTAWITLHVPGSIPASVSAALAEAEKSQPRSLDAFLDLFFTEIEENAKEKEFMDWLYGESTDHTVLRQDLRFRLLDFVSAGLLIRGVDVAPAVATQSMSRTLRATSNTDQKRVQPHLSVAQLAAVHAVYALAGRHLILTANPQGP